MRYNLSMSKATAIVNGYVLLDGLDNFYQRMKEELSELGVDLALKTTTELLSYINSDGNIELKEDLGDFVLFLDKDKYLSALLEKAGVRLYNRSESIRLCDDKMVTYIALANSGIKMPKTIGSPLNYFNSDDSKFLNVIESEFNYPIIAKRAYGSMGAGVYLLQNHDQLTSFINENKGIPTLFQEFIESSKGVDYRIIVIGGKAIGAMKRSNPNDFRSNIALGGTAEAVNLSENYLKVAEKAAKILNLDYCGVDVLIGNHGEPILCEVNSNAFIKGFEHYTCINVAKAYAEYIVNSPK